MFRLLVVTLTLWSAAAIADTNPAREPVPGEIIKYELQNGGMLATVGVDWGRYSKIQLERATVRFQENWVKKQRKLNNLVSEMDQELIRSEMSDLLERVLTRALTYDDRYELTDQPGTDVLRFSPRIEKLDVYAPGRTQGFVGHVLVDSKGSMVLVVEISDATSGELLASAWQLQTDPEKGFTETATSASNKTAFQQMMKRWANWLLVMLEHAETDPRG
jgi:hypothetical protein